MTAPHKNMQAPMPDAETSAFRARRAADRTAVFADEVIDLCIRCRVVAAEMHVAAVAARQARISATVAEAAAESDSRYSFQDAHRAHGQALRHEQSVALALRRLKERLPHIRHVDPDTSEDGEVIVLGTEPPFGLVLKEGPSYEGACADDE